MRFSRARELEKIMVFSDEEVETVTENVSEYEFVADIDENGDEGTDEDNCYDHMCAICDNGGDVLICDGKCMRSFHTTIQDDGAFYCESLGFTDEELQEIQDVPFICENCKYKVHQCFACGRLGSSDESSPEVFCCVNGTCGFFFHPDCVAKLLRHGDDAAAEELKQRIVAGEQFACPAHTCHVCKEVEVTTIKELQFAVCRRCPRAYHKICLPREITSEEDADMERGILQRVWEDLIPNRLLIYCLDHEIDPVLYTPARDHIKFPGPSRERKKMLPLESRERKKELESGSSVTYNLLKKRGVALEENAEKSIFAKPKVSSSLEPGRVKTFPLHVSSKKQKVSTNGNSLGKSNAREIPLGGKLYMDSEHAHSSTGGVLNGEYQMRQKVKHPAKRMHNSLTFDDGIKKRILSLMEDASSSVTLDQVKKKHIAPSTYVQSKNSFTLGKVEGLVQAVRAALKKLDEGCSIQEAKAVCGNDLLLQALRWKDKLKVYLAPFLYGMRYTSFGRHFTKPDKLKEIVDILHWYVKDGDMLVDFCCGSNDFSCLMKKKLDQMGKSCSFRNYDILQAKNDFNFERRDWMGVKPNELPDGSKLIMGLNPPFGFKAALANKFINKALEFKPKLLVLIVPQETHRLDEKESPYDLIWENDQMFVGKSFYLPGSVDVHDQQIEDWNINAPVLYLWSCPNWTSKHRAIAEQHRHLSGALQNHSLDDLGHYGMHEPNSAQECHDLKSFAKPESLDQKDRVTTATSHQDVNVKTSLNIEESCRSTTSSQAYVPGPPPCYGFRAPADKFVDPFEARADNFGNLLFRRMAYTPEFPFGEMGTSTMQHYAPRFNEANDARLGNMVPAQDMSSTYHPRGPLPSYRPLGLAPAPHSYSPWLDEMNDARMDNMAHMSSIYHPHGSRPCPFGFSPGPHPSYSQRSSSGWLNE